MLFASAMMSLSDFGMPPVLQLGAVLFCALLAAACDNRREREGSTLGVPILIWMIGGLQWLSLGAQLLSGQLRALPMLLLFTVLLLPWATVRWVLVPLSAARLAARLARLAAIRLQRDHLGGASLAAAWALLRGAPSRQQLDWLEQQLHRHNDLRGAGIVAHGLLWALRGDDEQTRRTLSGVLDMDPRVLPGPALQIATGWLAADAAARGDWNLARTLGHRPTGPRFGDTRFLGEVAARLGGDLGAARAPGRDPHGPSDWSLRWRWLLAANRRALWPLLQQALRTPPKSAAAPAPPISRLPVPMGAPLGAALTQHAQALRRYPPLLHERDLYGLAAAWDTALDSQELLLLACKRGQVLDADPNAARAQLARDLVEELAALARQARVPLDEAALPREPKPSPLLTAAAQALRSTLLGELEEAAGALCQRVNAGRILPILEECRQWESLRAQYEQAVHLGGPLLRQLIWSTYFRAQCSHGVWLFNARGAHVLGNTIARYLLAQALEMNDPERIDLQRKNVACGIYGEPMSGSLR